MKGYAQAQENYGSMVPDDDYDEPEEVEEPAIWSCCAGIQLDETERCPVCGDDY